MIFFFFFFVFFFLFFCHFYKGDNFCDFLFTFLLTKSLLKKFDSKRKEFAPKGSKFFPCRLDPFTKGMQNKFDRVASHENVSVSLN